LAIVSFNCRFSATKPPTTAWTLLDSDLHSASDRLLIGRFCVEFMTGYSTLLRPPFSTPVNTYRQASITLPMRLLVVKSSLLDFSGSPVRALHAIRPTHLAPHGVTLLFIDQVLDIQLHFSSLLPSILPNFHILDSPIEPRSFLALFDLPSPSFRVRKEN
jgi:hypothetical protein